MIPVYPFPPSDAQTGQSDRQQQQQNAAAAPRVATTTVSMRQPEAVDRAVIGSGGLLLSTR